MTTGDYIAASVADGGSNYPVVLFRETDGTSWVEAHRSSVALTSGRPGFSDVHGLVDGSFIAAVGCEFYHDSYATPSDAPAMSYFDGSSWHEVSVPSTYRLAYCYVPVAGVVYVGGYDTAVSDTAYIWRWTPAGGFVTVHSKYVSGGWPKVYRIRGTSGSDIWATMTYVDNVVYQPSWLAHFDGNSWTDFGTAFRFIAPVTPVLCWANGVRTSQTECIYKYSGSWTVVESIAAHSGNVAYSIDAVAGYALIGAAFGGINRLCRYDDTNGLVTKVSPGGGRRVNGIAIARDGDLDRLHCIAVTNASNGGTAYVVESTDAGETWGSESAITGYAFAASVFIAAIRTYPSSEAGPEGPYHLINNSNNYETDSSGRLLRDKTIASRCRARLCTRRGSWLGDLELGSRLHTIATLKNARQLAIIYINEALQPLIDSKEIEAIDALEFYEDSITGSLGVWVDVVTPGDERVPLGIVQIGG